MTTQRDELAREIHSTEQLGCGCCTDYNYTREQDQHADKLDVNPIAVAIGDTLLAAGWTKPRTITTAEELDALAVGSVVIDGHGDVCERFGNGWTGIIKERLMDTWLLTGAEDLPLDCTVLYEPTA